VFRSIQYNLFVYQIIKRLRYFMDQENTTQQIAPPQTSAASPLVPIKPGPEPHQRLYSSLMGVGGFVFLCAAVVLAFWGEHLIHDNCPRAVVVWVFAGGALLIAGLFRAFEFPRAQWLHARFNFWEPLLLLPGVIMLLWATWLHHKSPYAMTGAIVWVIGMFVLIVPWSTLYRLIVSRRKLQFRLPPKIMVQRIVIGLLVVFCCVLCLYDLTGIPNFVHGDEGEVGCWARRFMENDGFRLFSAQGWYQLPKPYFYVYVPLMKMLENDLLAVRLTSALMGLIGLLFFGLAVRLLWSVRVAAITVFLLSILPFFFHNSRLGEGYVQAFLLTAMAFYFLVRVLRGGGVYCLAMVGVACGLGWMSYFAARLIIFQVLGTYFIMLLYRRGFWKRAVPELLVIVMFTLLTLGPLLLLWSRSPNSINGRRGMQVTDPAAAKHMVANSKTGHWTEIAATQITNNLKVFHVKGCTSGQYGYKQNGLLDEATGSLFILGLALCLFYFRRPEYMLPLIWGGAILVAGGMMTIDTPFYPRLSAMPPFVILLVALGLEAALRRLDSLPVRWLRWSWVLVVAVVLVFCCQRSHYHYFQKYLNEARHTTVLTQLAGYLNKLPADTRVYMLAPHRQSIRHGTIRFLCPGIAGTDVLQPRQFIEKHGPVHVPCAWIFLNGNSYGEAELARKLFPGGVSQEFRAQNHSILQIYIPPVITPSPGEKEQVGVNSGESNP
jgi:4-amino-4-deoxy-L-arabinose transferase-like glycosyltransferase